jgi:hypothetical protein
MKRYDIKADSINSDATWEEKESQDGDFCLFKDVEKLEAELDALKKDARIVASVIYEGGRFIAPKDVLFAAVRIMEATKEDGQ